MVRYLASKSQVLSEGSAGRRRVNDSTAAKSSDPRRRRGIAGEKLARDYLECHGYKIIETNFRSRYGEIDIIASRSGIVAFIEVKARRRKSYGEPFEAVGVRKQNQIRRMAQMWLATHQNDAAMHRCIFRFDVISIILDESNNCGSVKFLQDAFR